MNKKLLRSVLLFSLLSVVMCNNLKASEDDEKGNSDQARATAPATAQEHINPKAMSDDSFCVSSHRNLAVRGYDSYEEEQNGDFNPYSDESDSNSDQPQISTDDVTGESNNFQKNMSLLNERSERANRLSERANRLTEKANLMLNKLDEIKNKKTRLLTQSKECRNKKTRLNKSLKTDRIGILFLIFFYFGWGRHVPINPFNITSPSRTIKLIFAYFSDTIAHFFLALCGLVVLIATFDIHILDVARYMILTRNVSHLYITHFYPNASSLTVSLAFIVVALIYLNFILGVLDLIINACSIIMSLVIERSPHYAMDNVYATILVPILLIWFFSEPLRFLAVNFISYAGYTIAHALCIA